MGPRDRRASVMMPVATNWPTSFDRDATKIAFKRGLGNRAPDNDQDAFTINPSGSPGFRSRCPTAARQARAARSAALWARMRR